jgi:acyl-coenzyme A thioesterase PaaI-like protein
LPEPTVFGAHPFDEALALTPIATTATQPDQALVRRWQGHTHAGYQNMVGPFGGVMAAQALNAVLQHPELLGDPVSLTVNFAAALGEGAFQAEARPVRTNRSTQHWLVSLVQSDEAGAESTMVTATAVTAKRRATWCGVDGVKPDAPVPESIPRAVAIRPTAWIPRYDMRFCAGEPPREWNGAERDSMTRLWVRDDPPRPLDFCSLAAMADVFYPRIWRKRALLTPAGTVSMTVYFHAGAAELAAAGTGYLLGQACGQRFFHGFFDQRAELWSEAGALLATTHQIVYFKE